MQISRRKIETNRTTFMWKPESPRGETTEIESEPNNSKPTNFEANKGNVKY